MHTTPLPPKCMSMPFQTYPFFLCPFSLTDELMIEQIKTSMMSDELFSHKRDQLLSSDAQSSDWIKPNSMASPEGERSLVLWDLSATFWDRNVSDHKRLLWPDDQ